MTFGQRIELGSALSDQRTTDKDKFKEVIRIMDGETPDLLSLSLTDVKALYKRFNEVVTEVKQWVEKEKKMLSEPPSDLEKRAGIEEYNTNVGYLGTAASLAKAYNTDPDEVLKWEYSKVFGLLYVSLEEYRYRKRYQKLLEDKK